MGKYLLTDRSRPGELWEARPRRTNRSRLAEAERFTLDARVAQELAMQSGSPAGLWRFRWLQAERHRNGASGRG